MTKKYASCLVTGGAGFIGSAISGKLFESFDEVVAIDSLLAQVHGSGQRPDLLDERVNLIVGDVTDPHVWDSVLKQHKFDVVIHLAAETGTGQSLTEASRHAHVNVTGTAQMTDAFGRHGHVPKRLILSSSRAVYGEGAWMDSDGSLFYPGQRTRAMLASSAWDFAGKPLPMDAAETRTDPVSVYGATKLAQEHLLKAWADANGSECVVLRLQNVFGPGQSLINSYTGIVSLFCQVAAQKQAIQLYEDGEMLRDFVLIDDVASALVLAVTSEEAVGKTIDIGNGLATTIRDVAEAIAKIYNAPQPEVCGKYRFGDVRHARSDIKRAQELLNWAPAHSLNEGLLKLVNWIESTKK